MCSTNSLERFIMFFFFSSRRRHTRLQGDWSSDVCSSEFREANDFAEISLADFGAGGDVTNHRECGIASGSAGGEDMHGGVFEDVDLDARGFDDGADFLFARTDEVADLVLRDLLLGEARGVSRNLRPGGAQG